MTKRRYQTEFTEQGEQSLVPGIRPVAMRERLQALAEAPLGPRRAQKPCNRGLFDDDARNQFDLFIHGQDDDGPAR